MTNILYRCHGPRCEDCHNHTCVQCHGVERVHCVDDECDGTGTCRDCYYAEKPPSCADCGCPEAAGWGARCTCECHADPDGERERAIDREAREAQQIGGAP